MILPKIFIFTVFIETISTVGAASPCTGLMQLPSKLDGFVSSFLAKDPPCGSARLVLQKIGGRAVAGGRKLEPEKPLDMRLARQNLELALKDPEVRKLMERAEREIPDINVRLAYEASILDDNGFYSARELKLQQLLQQIN